MCDASASVTRPCGSVPGMLAIIGNSQPAFIHAALAPAQIAGASLEPGTVIAGEKHQGFFSLAICLQRSQNFADTPINFLDHVAVQSQI